MQQTTPSDTPVVSDVVSECNHHWLIESPNGPESTGQCKTCGEVRAFKNSVQVTSWESDGNHLHRNRSLAATPRL